MTSLNTIFSLSSVTVSKNDVEVDTATNCLTTGTTMTTVGA